MQPQVLVLDEPTSQLDPIAATEFLNAVYRINSELGTTVIMTEHRTEFIFSQADRVVFVDNGKIVADSCPGMVFRSAKDIHPYILHYLPTPMQVFYGVGETGEAPVSVKKGRSWLKKYTAENSFSQLIYNKKDKENNSSATVTMKNVWFRYEKDSEDILKNLDLTVNKGCFYAIIGANGSGKSTLLKTLCGIHRPYRGKISTDGKAAFLPQEAVLLFAYETVREELREMTKDESRIARAVKIGGLEEIMDSHPYDISVGQQQRVALAKILLSGADILLLDEVTKGMDAIYKREFGKIVNRLCESGKTVIMVSHDIEFCSEYAHRVGMFFNGTVVSEDVPQVFFSKNNFYTTAGARLTKGIFENTVNPEDIISLCRINLNTGNI